jgi:hypothetical protein
MQLKVRRMRYLNGAKMSFNNRSVQAMKSHGVIVLTFKHLHKLTDGDSIKPNTYTAVLRNRIHLTEFPLTYEAAEALIEVLTMTLNNCKECSTLSQDC